MPHPRALRLHHGGVYLESRFARVDHHLIVYALEENALYDAANLPDILADDHDILGAYHNVHGLVADQSPRPRMENPRPRKCTSSSCTISPRMMLLSPIKSATKALAGSS